jgi:hypothetical protein
MKWYFASRIRHKDTLQKVAEIIRRHGHELAFDWVVLPSLKPYSENSEACQQLAGQISEAIISTDVFVLISDAAGTDMFLETGLALATKANGHPLSIYNVGPYNQRSLMQFHPDLIPVNSLAEIFKIHLPEAESEISEIDKLLKENFQSG